jgi:LytS/YehU family sensor histidine kinase
LNRALPIQVTLEIAEGYLVVRNSKQEKAYDEKNQNGTGLKNIEVRYRFFTDKAVKITDTETTFEVAIPLLEIDD